MKHFLLKFNHGVEIGAYLAYEGHYKRTKDPKIHSIIMDELDHRTFVRAVLKDFSDDSSNAIDYAFWAVGITIYHLCKIAPIWSLDFIARIMEFFAVFSYEMLAKKYPAYKPMLLNMAKTERQHAEYFRGKI